MLTADLWPRLVRAASEPAERVMMFLPVHPSSRAGMQRCASLAASMQLQVPTENGLSAKLASVPKLLCLSISPGITSNEGDVPRVVPGESQHGVAHPTTLQAPS